VNVSDGVFVAPFGDGGVAYDVLTETAHVLGADGWHLLEEIRDASAPPDLEGVAQGIDALRRLGLIGRAESVPLPTPAWVPAADGRSEHVGEGHVVLHQCVAFRCADAALVHEIDAYLATGQPDRPPTVVFDIERTAYGQVVLQAGEEWVFPDWTSFLLQLVGVLNDHAARSHAVAVLHSGAVLSPQDGVLLVPGAEGVGKSTLVAALIQAGCDYLSDEAIGVRPTGQVTPYPKLLELDQRSRQLIGLTDVDDPYISPMQIRDDVGVVCDEVPRVAAIVFASYAEGATFDMEVIPPVGALRMLLGNTLNLARGGSDGLQSLCRLAEDVPAFRLVHGGAVDAAKELCSTSDVRVVMGRA
jgi:hypothetical protein